jgi:hypothetical protein
MTQNSTGVNYKPLSEKEKWVAAQVVDIAICIHKALGPDCWKVYMRNAFVMNCQKEIFLSRNKNQFGCNMIK